MLISVLLKRIPLLFSVESSRKGAFGSTSTRIAPMTRRQEDQMPGINPFVLVDF